MGITSHIGAFQILDSGAISDEGCFKGSQKAIAKQERPGFAARHLKVCENPQAYSLAEWRVSPGTSGISRELGMAGVRKVWFQLIERAGFRRPAGNRPPGLPYS
jgi:hypothetical protein